MRTKHTHVSNFSLYDKRVKYDERLTKSARFLFVRMWDLPNDWSFSISGLCAVYGESRNSISKAILNLEKYGYVKRNGSQWLLDDMPNESHEAEVSKTHNTPSRKKNVASNAKPSHPNGKLKERVYHKAKTTSKPRIAAKHDAVRTRIKPPDYDTFEKWLDKICPQNLRDAKTTVIRGLMQEKEAVDTDLYNQGMTPIKVSWECYYKTIIRNLMNKDPKEWGPHAREAYENFVPLTEEQILYLTQPMNNE